MKGIQKKQCGPSHPAWRGGIEITPNGYVRIRVDGKRYLEHRYIMERFLNRKLLKIEYVHHKNGIKTDNDLKNLEVVLESDHTRNHNYLLESQRDEFGRFVHVWKKPGFVV